MLKLYNTAGRKIETFQPIRKRSVYFYTCGPTVYAPAHLGNLRSYIFADILKRTLLYNGFQVKHIMNITDVGHLVGDRDEGEDKVLAAARAERKTAWQVAAEYAKMFQTDLKRLNILSPTRWVKATDHIKEQIELILRLEKKGFTYRTSDGIYFDTSKFPAYGKFARLDLKGLRAGERVAVGEKQHPTDFALWKFSYPVFDGLRNSASSQRMSALSKRDMEWGSPWGIGFPGWHIECSAMSREYLGQPFDIHTGGIDHIQVHHTNEIAQSVAAYGKPLANYWLHNDFLVFPEKDGPRRMGKSEHNIITVNDLLDRGFDPLAYRYLCLTVHYRKKLEFSWAALEAAAAGLKNLRELIVNFPLKVRGIKGGYEESYEKQFLTAINNDLNTPEALALIWKLVKSKTEINKLIIKKFDHVLGLNLLERRKIISVPVEVKKLVAQRENLRKQKHWQEADMIRKKIEKKGFVVEDTGEGAKIKKNYEV